MKKSVAQLTNERLSPSLTGTEFKSDFMLYQSIFICAS